MERDRERRREVRARIRHGHGGGRRRPGVDLAGAACTLLGEINLDVPRASLTHLVPTISRLLESVGPRRLARSTPSWSAAAPGRSPACASAWRPRKASRRASASRCYGVGTLDAIAERFAARDGLLGVVGRRDAPRGLPGGVPLRRRDGRRDWRRTRSSTPAESPRPGPPSSTSELLLAGNGLRKYADVFTRRSATRATVAPEASWTPTGESLLLAAWRASGAGLSATATRRRSCRSTRASPTPRRTSARGRAAADPARQRRRGARRRRVTPPRERAPSARCVSTDLDQVVAIERATLRRPVEPRHVRRRDAAGASRGTGSSRTPRGGSSATRA